ncbi:uncharacterized protein [Littorina saxatilis]|uniref:uncharacterized protein n=1 Tax=Littorina saxatilis TaxID=31220 RepID=UPI0038B69627
METTTTIVTKIFVIVKTVFAITNQAGVTLSFSEAERRLKKEASENRCYYNTFKRRFELEYKSTAGHVHRSLSLRDCHIIVLVDNLVRLTFHSDPSRGVARSSQVCMLPVSIKGLPRDAETINSWHNPDCDGLPGQKCVCMEPVTLTPDDVSPCLLNPSHEESFQFKKFKRSFAHGIAAVWDKVKGSLARTVEPALSEISSDDENTHSLDISGIEEFSSDDTPAVINADDIQDPDTEEGYLDTSFANLSVQDSHPLTTEVNSQASSGNGDESDHNSMGFRVYCPPPLISRHPPPYTGRDDDLMKLREILTDILVKTGFFFAGKHKKFPGRDESRIILAPDHKIAANLFRLMKENSMFQIFLPEFPLLHLRKSKIVNLLSAYKDAGLSSLTRFLHDSEETDLKKIVRPENIESATTFVKRLALALQTAFFLTFHRSLSPEDAAKCSKSLDDGKLEPSWLEKLEDFMETGQRTNATFALHCDILHHALEILAIALAEKIGGPDGYRLLLAAVKSSLAFSFVNGASSYAGFCTQLLVEHHSAGFFHQKMKETLFSTPFKDSKRNFALDSQREMEHKAALKGFRSRSTVDSVLPRLSLVDKFEEMEAMGMLNQSQPVLDSVDAERADNEEIAEVTWKTTQKDLDFVIPTANLILRTGEYLIRKFLIKEKMMDMSRGDGGDVNQIKGPKELVSKVKSGKGVTIKRMTSKIPVATSTSEKKEKKRKALVRKQSKVIDGLSSARNTCQAVMTPECQKLDPQKASGIRNALLHLLSSMMEGNKTSEEQAKLLQELSLVFLAQHDGSSAVFDKLASIIIEFAGVKFKVVANTGLQYLRYAQNSVIMRCLKFGPDIKKIVVVEEKYSFTPDLMKAATRTRREPKTTSASIGHLKVSEELISRNTYDKSSITSTSSGKQAVSSYLAANISSLEIKNDIMLMVDSELHVKGGCQCQDASNCGCSPLFAVPLSCEFTKGGFKNKPTEMIHIAQRKGEAEMAQLDWLLELLPSLQPGEGVLSVVTSGDIDAVVIHLFVISNLWPRSSDGKFQHPVHVMLQKAKGMSDVYNITAIVEQLESRFGHYAALKIAILLSMGGNDFLPKFHGITHSKLLQTVMEQGLLHSLFSFSSQSGKLVTGNIKEDVYLKLLMSLYCPTQFDLSKLSFEEVRQYSTKRPRQATVNNPQQWMPPKEALSLIVNMINWQIAYLFTAGQHSSNLPMMQGPPLFSTTEASTWGSAPIEDLCLIPDHVLARSFEIARRQGTKRTPEDTPQKGQRRKRIAVANVQSPVSSNK